MAQGGQANITIIDGGSATIIVPGSSLQLVIGCCSSGTVNQIIATRTPATLQSYLGYGPLVEAAGLVCLAGGTVLAIKCASAVAGTASTVTATGAGTSVMTVTGAPVDTYFVKVLVVNGGTIGTAGCTIQLSLDAGRSYGPVISLGTATTYVVGTTGMTLNFAAGTLITNGTFTFGTTEPTWNTAAILAALQAFQASQYAITGVGSTHIVGATTGANCSTIEGYLDNLATNDIFTRAFMSARDASPAAIWGGTAETEATWMSAIQTDFSATAARRACVGAAFWNMPTAFPVAQIAGAPSYRRPIAWAAAARAVTVPAQRHIGRVKDGNVSQITVNPTSDPQDGFIYHNEAVNPGLDFYINNGSGGRFMSTMTRTGLPGVYITNPLTMAPLGSDYWLMPLGSVMDIFCTIIHQQGQLLIDDDVRLNNNGTIYENDARNIENALAFAVNSILWAQKMVSQPVAAGPAGGSGPAIIVDRTTNVKATGACNITGTIAARGYLLTVNFSLGFLNPAAAA